MPVLSALEESSSEGAASCRRPQQTGNGMLFASGKLDTFKGVGACERETILRNISSHNGMQRKLALFTPACKGQALPDDFSTPESSTPAEQLLFEGDPYPDRS